MEKKGMPTGLQVTHPLTGAPVDVWVGNYVLMSYGDGAVMGVPAHDERDFAFARKYGLPIRQVVAVDGETFDDTRWQPWYEDKARGRCVHSGRYDGMAHDAAVDAIAADLAAKGLGEKKVTFRLRDWGVSRQRYWGTPIPIIHCDACGSVPVPERDLPVVLPEDCVPDGSGNPLAKREDFLAVACPCCGKPARRETDTLDTFVDSSWYYMRYACPDAPTMVDARNDYWMPMDQYIGGIEHAILHLLYARFWTKVMRDMGLVTFDEPFTRLLTQGMVLNHSWFVRNDKGGMEYHPPADVTPIVGGDGRIAGGKLADGTPVEYGGVSKMSKSEKNGVDPEDLIERYGADTARHFVMFASPPEATLEWSDTGVEGSYRFLKRLWAWAQGKLVVVRGSDRVPAGTGAGEAAKAARREVHLALRQANYDYERVQYNTVVSAGYKMLNALDALSVDAPGAEPVIREGLSILLRVLYPVVPHVTWALWRDLGYADELGDLLDAPWPEVDEGALAQDAIELVLQVNGKLRGKLVVPATADRAAIEAAARASEDVAKHAGGAPVKKVVVVPGRLVNVVV
jgi:leucyl-tRNA synthetase